MRRKVDIVVSVDAEDLLHDIAFAGDVDHVCRRSYNSPSGCPFNELIVQVLKYLLDGLAPYLLADETLDTALIKFDAPAFDPVGINLLDLADDFSSGQLLDKEGGAPEGERNRFGIGAALITE